MKSTRRHFFRTAATGSLGGAFMLNSCSRSASIGSLPDYEPLDRILEEPVLQTDGLDEPVIIDKLELLRYRDNFLCRVISSDGAEGISVSNNAQMKSLYPIFTNRLQPFFRGKDATAWERLLDEVYVYGSNYKLQDLALWVPLATIEFAVLDMLGKLTGKSMGKLIGEIHNPDVHVYQANNFRGKSAEESLELIRQQVSESKANALKIKIGGRMSRNADYPPGRTEQLIPLVSKAFGSDMVLFADSNGSYTADEAIRIGKILEEYGFEFFEEPVPFDWYEETLEVADALEIPVAGGEQEPSTHNFRWLIGNDALQVVQPDIFYFGGMIRSMKVARMAGSLGKVCTPHISGSGLGYLYNLHFISAVPNAGVYHEFKGFNTDIPMEIPESARTVKDGRIKVPTGPGLGVTIDPDYIKLHEPVRS